MGVFACSDLHGCWQQWEAIQKFCKDSDKIYVLGDCIDRGSDPIGVLKSVLADPRATLICGNHEDMMMQALEEEQLYGYSDYWMWIWFNNGGRITYNQWQEDGMDYSWVQKIRELPTYAKYTNENGINIVMTHSGAVPKAGHDVSSLSRKTQIWDRDHLSDKFWHRDANEISLFGHTPTLVLPEYLDVGEVEPGAMWFCDGHKCDIDNGGFFTGDICLLDLDTFEEHIF